MDNLSSRVCQFIENLVDGYDPHYGCGFMTCSVYDTAWLSMVKKSEEGANIWLFPDSFQFILDQQQDSGGWQAYASPIDGILNTAAALFALCQHREAPYQIETTGYNLDQRISSAKVALQDMLLKWEVSSTLHVGYEILVPALLESLKQYNLLFQFNGQHELSDIRAKKLSMIDFRQIEDENGKAHSILHSLEGLEGWVNYDKLAFRKVRGSIMASPAATSAYLTRASIWDDEAEMYLRNVVSKSYGKGNGSVPSAFPTTLFEYNWALTTLFVGGFTEESIGKDKLDVFRTIIEDEFHKRHGLVGFAPQIQPDADDTAKAIVCLNLLGVKISATALVNEFWDTRGYFKTYPKERNASISSNCNVLAALLSNDNDIRSHSSTIVQVTRFLCCQWYNSPALQDKWNISPFYTIMLLAQALSQVLSVFSDNKDVLLVHDRELFENDVPLVLLQILINTLQGQQSDGAWGGSRETTAYALLTINAVKDFGKAWQQQVELALQRGRSFLLAFFDDENGLNTPDYLWVEKVTYGSKVLSNAYTYAALWCSSPKNFRSEASSPSNNVCNIGPTDLSATAKLRLSGKSYSAVPLLQNTPQWLIQATLMEANSFRSKLKQKHMQVFGNLETIGKQLDFVPFTWTISARIVNADIGADILEDMMAISSFLYTLDSHVEHDIASQNVIQRRAVRMAVNDEFDYITQYGHLPAPDIAKLDKIFYQFVQYVWEHPKVRSAAEYDKRLLLLHLRLLLLTHLDQVEDNCHLQSQKHEKRLANPQDTGPSSKLCTGISSPCDNHYGSLYSWIQTTSGHHTGGPMAFFFLLCLTASGTEALPSIRAKYFAEQLSQHIAAFSRLSNDYGSIERDHAEGNLNSVDFFTSPGSVDPTHESRVIREYSGKEKTDKDPVLTTHKEELLSIVQHEKRRIDTILHEALDGLVCRRVATALEMFSTAVDMYGQMYILKDHTPRTPTLPSTPSPVKPFLLQEFMMSSPVEADVIVIGGGTAGLVLAARLSEDANINVLVLEAGLDQKDDPRVKTPALWPGLVGTESDWGFVTLPQEALNGKQLPLPQGRLIGGSSAINGMAFIANSQVNVDAWGKLGNPDWNWKTLEPYYKKTYTLTLPSEEQQKQLGLEYVDRQTSGFEGPLHASYPDAIKDPVANAWIESLRSLGFPMSGDPFSGNAFGGYINAATIEPVEKTRSYSQTAYYEPIKDRSNLRIITGALVEKILFRHTDPDEDIVATGCQYRNNGISHTVTARQTVIISAGAFNSPKILELSGIGSHAILEKHEIEVLIDNPNVGENLQDHVLAGLSFEVQDSINTKDDLMRRVPAALGAAMEEYKTNRFGPFTVGGNYSSALLPIPDFSNPATGKSELLQVLNLIPESSEDSFSSDLGSFVRTLLSNPHEATGGYFTYPAQSDFKGSGAGDEVLRTKFPENYITVAVSLLHPLSRGSSHITSSDVADSPAIDPRYLTHPLDVELLARHTRYIESIVASPPLASILKPGGKRSPGVPDDLRKAPLEEVKDYVKSAAKSTWHPTSTCAMMPREKGGVVDSRFRVWGTTNLRVVDASVIPIATRGNTQSSVYAIAERAVDLIKHDLVST